MKLIVIAIGCLAAILTSFWLVCIPRIFLGLLSFSEKNSFANRYLSAVVWLYALYGISTLAYLLYKVLKP